jgi:lysozyme family protein
MEALEDALYFTMKWEVGPWFKLDADTLAGRCDTAANGKKVGFVDDPLDNGGCTKFGVAQNSHRDIDVRSITWETAKNIYYKDYWLAGSCDKLPRTVAIAHFDACVNHGVKQANKFLQRALGVPADGILGPITLSAAHKNDNYLTNMLEQRANFFKAIVQQKPLQGRFLNGWLNRVNDLKRALGV